MLDRILALEEEVSALKKEATETEPGLVRISKSAAVTDSTGMALAASEKNAALEGTIMNAVSSIDTSLNQFMNRLKVEVASLGYNQEDKSALGKIDNPTSIFGRKLTPYAILFTDSIGDTIYGGGTTLFIGYTYPDDKWGAQLRMKYSDNTISVRRKTTGTWGEWRTA